MSDRAAPPRPPVLAEAIQRAGGGRALAAALGITEQAVSRWRIVPPERVLGVEAASGVSRYRLRPDIYGPEPKQADRLVEPDFERVAVS